MLSLGNFPLPPVIRLCNELKDRYMYSLEICDLHVWRMRRLEMSSSSGKFSHLFSTRERQWRNCYAYLKFIFSCKNTHTYYILLIANSALNVDFSTLIPRFSFKAHALSKSRLKPDRTWTSKNIAIDVNKINKEYDILYMSRLIPTVPTN